MSAVNAWAYLKERFAPVNMLLFAILFLTVYMVARYFSFSSSAPVSLNVITGIFAVISFFFRLRVFDEVKDFNSDSLYHPHRVLQSGRVKLSQLITASILTTSIEITWSIANGYLTVISWCIAIGYSLLMRYEFFVPRFLKKRLLLYAFSHLLVMPLIIAWVWSAFYGGGFFKPSLFLLAALSLAGGFCFELARKIHAPDAERQGVDSYSKALGFLPSIICVLACLGAGIFIQCRLLGLVNAGTRSYLLLGALYLFTMAAYIVSINKKQEKNLRFAELLVSLFMLLSYLTLITVIYSAS